MENYLVLVFECLKQEPFLTMILTMIAYKIVWSINNFRKVSKSFLILDKKETNFKKFFDREIKRINDEKIKEYISDIMANVVSFIGKRFYLKKEVDKTVNEYSKITKSNLELLRGQVNSVGVNLFVLFKAQEFFSNNPNGEFKTIYYVNKDNVINKEERYFHNFEDVVVYVKGTFDSTDLLEKSGKITLGVYEALEGNIHMLKEIANNNEGLEYKNLIRSLKSR